jgi:hypothetical protein
MENFSLFIFCYASLWMDEFNHPDKKFSEIFLNMTVQLIIFY